MFPRLTGGIRWGLDRTEALLSAVGNPQHAFKSIHIGGTNGKGSVAATVASILRADGKRVGLYSSPHLCTFRERIQIDSKAISENDILAAAEQLWPHIDDLQPSFFEATTALGFLALANANVEWGVIEVGLGGRLDSTNVINPEVAVITNIAMDHKEYLGDTVEKIAVEKAGIIKPGVPVFTAESNPRLLEIFRENAGENLIEIDEPQNIRFDKSGTSFEYEGIEYHTPLIGHHQALNAALAIKVTRRLAVPPSRRLAITWPGRLQIQKIDQTTWVFDVAHNVAGVRALASAIEDLDLPKPIVALIGILGDKDWPAMLPPLFDLADAKVLTKPPTAPANRTWNPDGVEPDFVAAMRKARNLAGNGTVLVTGSFHTVGDAMIVLDIAPFGSDVALPHLSATT